MREPSSSPTATEALIELVTSYHELNGVHIDEFDRAPSPLSFMQYIAKNRPLVIRRGAEDWPAISLWSPEYLMQKMENTMVRVAVTPSGNADSAVRSPVDGKWYFTKPLEIDEPFGELLTYIRQQEQGKGSPAEVKYSQAQDDNMRGEYSKLYPDIAEDVNWATECFGAKPDAINVWIGNSRSITSLHKDNYENIYCQVSGKKRFVLLSPVETPCVNLQLLAQASYARDSASSNLILVPESPLQEIPWPLWDPDRPKENDTLVSPHSRPLHVELEPGDMLYLPTLWYHKVSQECLGDDVSISVNYWYDMSFGGLLYAANTFISNVSKIAGASTISESPT